MNVRYLAASAFAVAASVGFAAPEVVLSRAGYWEAPSSPRLVRSMNPGWEFSLDGFKTTKDVNLPHCLDEGEIGLNASGGVNRRQKAWYRKTFTWRRSRDCAFLHFEAIMGKSEISLNGKTIATHFGGFLPIHVDVTRILKEGDNTLVVVCDNSDDPSYPPGKSQDELDWTYFGGIYRDVFLVETGKSYVTDSDRGGVYVTSRLEADASWTVTADVTLGGASGATVDLLYDGKPVARQFKPANPAPWSPDSPTLHNLDVIVRRGAVTNDSVRVKFGIRDFRLTKDDGLVLNGRPHRKLIGVNRHQDFAFIGMALANSLHVRDAMKYRAAGCTAIRSAHYPQDPAFMDACDALGLFVIVPTPGWQFWNAKDPLFAARVYDDIVKTARRDRSHASLLMWEPILNETRYPAEFARKARELVKGETRAPNYCACDGGAAGKDVYDVHYAGPHTDVGDRPTFTREWGDCPDDWYSQNSPSRVRIGWGETPMLVQADHYTYATTYGANLRAQFASAPGHFGGTLWHGADHARGYHPDNFFGGIVTYTRREKYSYAAFRAALTKEPFVFAANDLAPYSPRTLTVFSNCAYRATWKGREVHSGDTLEPAGYMAKDLALVVTRADGVVTTNRPAGRFAGVRVSFDTMGVAPRGDGSDLVACVASMVDFRGNVRHYQRERVRFSVEGNAQLVGENPQVTEWGEAVVLVRPLAPGKIVVRAALDRAGPHVGKGGSATLDVLPSALALVAGRVTPKPGETARVTPPTALCESPQTVDLAAVARAQDEFALTPSAPRETFLPSGRVALGANYWASHAATKMWTNWNAAEVEKDLVALKEAGLTILRVFPNWADFQPIVAVTLSAGNWNKTRETRMFLSEEKLPDTPCGRAGVDERMVERFEAFCDLAEKHGFRLIVPLLTGQMTFRNFIPPALVHLDPFADPYALKWEARYVECLVTRLREKKAIVAWETGNEARILGKSDCAERAEFWQRYIHDVIRRADASRPVIGVDGLELSSESTWPTTVNAMLSDFVTTHPYHFWGNGYLDDFRSIRSTLYASSTTHALADVAGLPAFVEEHGSRRQEQTSTRHLADYLRAHLWNVWDSDCRGMLWWCAFDQTGQEIAPYDWKEPCVELGLFRRNRSPYPGVESVKRFAAFQKALPFEALPKARPNALFIVSDPDVARSAFILAKQAGLRPAFQSAEQPLRDAKVYFLPSAAGRAGLSLGNWRLLKEKVAAGATLYVSVNDTFLDAFDEVAGIEIDSRVATGETAECAFPGFKVTLGSAVTRRYRATTAEVIAKDRKGNGVFFRNRYGKGKVYALAMPMEARFYKTAGSFASEAHRIYELVAPVWKLLKTGSRDVVATEHCFGGGRCGVVVVNNSPVPYAAAPELAKGWHVIRALTDRPDLAAWRKGRLELGPNAGILLMAAKDGVKWE